MANNENQYEHYLGFAHQLADAASRSTLPAFRNVRQLADKGANYFDPVTEADRAAEAAMRALIAAHYPDHGIAGEEYPEKQADSDFRWILDPIDGTRAYISGIPLWGTLIGLTHSGRPVLGMMDQPYLGERFWNDGNGAFFRNRSGTRRISARRCAALSDATLGATTPEMFKGDQAGKFQRLAADCRMTRYGADCYMYCMLATGHVDIVAEANLKPYDIVPLIPVIEAAGGKVTSWTGADAASGGDVLAVGDPSLHAAALAPLQNRKTF